MNLEIAAYMLQVIENVHPCMPIRSEAVLMIRLLRSLDCICVTDRKSQAITMIEIAHSDTEMDVTIELKSGASYLVYFKGTTLIALHLEGDEESIEIDLGSPVEFHKEATRTARFILRNETASEEE